nr:hypothetical protein [Tanacetum cinerariifolium]
MQQPMQNPKNISDLTTAIDMELVLMDKAFTLNDTTLINNNQRISSNPSNMQIAQTDANGLQNVGNYNRLSVDPGIANPYGIRNVVIAQAEANGACEETNRANANFTLENNFQQASTSGTQSDKAPVYDSDGSAEKMALGYQNPFYLKQAQQKQQSLYNGKVLLEKHDPPVVYDSEETLQLAQEKATKFVRDFKSLTKEADEFIVKHNALELKMERLLRAVVSHDNMSVVQNNSVVDTLNLQTDLERTKEHFENYIIKKENDYAKLWNDWYKKCEECKYEKISYDKAYNDMQQRFERLQDQLVVLKVIPKVDKTNALSKPVTSNSAPSTRESKVMQTINVIAPRIFRTNPSKTYGQQANSDSNGFFFTIVNNTTMTRRPHCRTSNTDRVPSKSKSNCLSNNVKKIEKNPRNSQIPKNQNHMSSECNNITLAIQNAKSEIVCVMCKQCLVTANHDVFVLNYVNDMNSYADNQSANVSKPENQKKHKANAKKLKELGSKVSLASSRPSKPRTCLCWIPTGIIFSMCGKLSASSNTKNKSKNLCVTMQILLIPRNLQAKCFRILPLFLI